MTVDPKDLRAGQRIDLVTDDGVEIRNLLLSARGGKIAAGDLFGRISPGLAGSLLCREGGWLVDGITVTAIRSQPDPELWLDQTGVCWHWQPTMNRWEDQGGCHWQPDVETLRVNYGPLRRLVPESEAS